MSITKHSIELRLRVLTYREDKVYVAHALEMDLIGEGESANKAIQNLRGAVEAQLSFAVQKGDPRLLDFSASQDIVERYERAFRENLHDLAMGDSTSRQHCEAQYLVIDGPELDQLRKRALKQGAFQSSLEPSCV